MLICDRCGKGLQVGMNVSHSHVRTKKRSLPNIHSVRVFIGDNKQRMSLCTKCLRIVREEEKGALAAREKAKVKIETKAAAKAREEFPKESEDTLDITKEIISAK